MYRSFPANWAMNPPMSVASLDRERGELERGDPALGPLLQGGDVVRERGPGRSTSLR